MEILFRVNSTPKAQPRQRHAIVAGHVRNYTPTDSPVNSFKAAVKYAAYEAYSEVPIDRPLRLKIVAVFPRPKNMIWKSKPMPREPKPSKPDFDNLAKSVCDALNGLVWRDDSLICCATVEKWIASGSEQPHVFVQINSIDIEES